MIRRAISVLFVGFLCIVVMADVHAAQCGTQTQAEIYPQYNGSTTYPTREAAYDACKGAIGRTILNTQNNNVISTISACERDGSQRRYRWMATSSGTRYDANCVVTSQGAGTPGEIGPVSTGWLWANECPAGSSWNEATKRCDAPCSSKPAMQNVRFQLSTNSDTTCSGGCEYAVDLQGGTGQSGRVNLGGVAFYRAASMSPTGASCTVGNQPVANDGQACTQQGNLTQCVKADGQHCATASSGKQFCWQPGENGIKASGNDAATKSPDGTTPKPPPLPPNNGGEWTQTGQSTVVTNTNNTTTSSTVTGWQSNYGSQGQGASGNGASGEGNAGNGSGSGLGNGNGNGNGNGDDEGDDDGPGAPGAGVDDLYSPTDKTVAGVFAAFKARVGDAPMMDAIDSFFTVTASGSCPTWTVPASEYNDTMALDWHCSGNVLAALQAIGWVIMALAAFFAAMWALS